MYYKGEKESRLALYDALSHLDINLRVVSHGQFLIHLVQESDLFSRNPSSSSTGVDGPRGETVINKCIYSFIQQIFVKPLLYTRLCCRL